MRINKEEVPLVMDSPHSKIRSPGSWGGMLITYSEYSERFDLSPMLEGLPDNMCHCPHWGYVLKGAFHTTYPDGSVEVTRAGDIFYTPPRHGGWVERGTAVLSFNPEKEFNELMKHAAGRMGG